MKVKRGLFWRTPWAEEGCFCIAEEHELGEEYTPMNHKREWEKLPKKLTGGVPFDYYPRGRVEIKRNKAIIFLNPVLNTQEFLSVLVKRFALFQENGIQRVQVKTDNSYHYHYHSED